MKNEVIKSFIFSMCRLKKKKKKRAHAIKVSFYFSGLENKQIILGSYSREITPLLIMIV